MIVLDQSLSPNSRNWSEICQIRRITGVHWRWAPVSWKPKLLCRRIAFRPLAQHGDAHALAASQVIGDFQEDDAQFFILTGPSLGT
jgi:hypothetical protein